MSIVKIYQDRNLSNEEKKKEVDNIKSQIQKVQQNITELVRAMGGEEGKNVDTDEGWTVPLEWGKTEAQPSGGDATGAQEWEMPPGWVY